MPTTRLMEKNAASGSTVTPINLSDHTESFTLAEHHDSVSDHGEDDGDSEYKDDNPGSDGDAPLSLIKKTSNKITAAGNALGSPKTQPAPKEKKKRPTPKPRKKRKEEYIKNYSTRHNFFHRTQANLIKKVTTLHFIVLPSGRL